MKRKSASPDAAKLVMKWIRQTYHFPSNIKLKLETYDMDNKWDYLISVVEDFGFCVDQGGGTYYSTHEFNILAWDGDLQFLGIHYRKKPLHVGDPEFFKKLEKSIVTPTLKNFLHFPSNVFYTKARPKL